MSTDNRVPELDFLRFIAIVLVLFRHVLIVPEWLFYPVQVFFLQFRKFGWIGVDLFFVLSGFLVSGLLFTEYQKNNTIRPLLFLIRRAMKLYPAFYAFLMITLVFKWKFDINSLSLKGILGETLFLQNYLGSLWSHTWSLAVEEHFYLLLVIGFSLIGVLNRTRRESFKIVPCLCLGTCCLLTVARVFFAYTYSFTWEQILTFTHFRVDSLLFGVFLSYEYHYNRDRFVRFFRGNYLCILVCCIVMILAVMILSIENAFVFSAGLTLLYIGFGGLMAVLITWQGEYKQHVFGKLSLFAFLGRHSYSIYLWHYFAYILSVNTVRWFWRYDFFEAEILLYLGGTFILGVGTSLLIEQPFLRLRDKYFPSRSRSLPVEVPESLSITASYNGVNS